MKKLFYGVFLLVATFPAYSGPFGLEMGQKIDDLKKIMDLKQNENNSGWYHTSTVPLPYADFEEYVLSILPEEGLCNVAGMSGPIKTDDNGAQFIRKFSKLESLLIAKYGKPFVRLSVQPVKNWVEKMYSSGDKPLSLWSSKDWSIPDSNLRSVKLQTDTISKDEVVINLVYFFDSTDKCVPLNPISKSLLLDLKNSSGL